MYGYLNFFYCHFKPAGPGRFKLEFSAGIGPVPSMATRGPEQTRDMTGNYKLDFVIYRLDCKLVQMTEGWGMPNSITRHYPAALAS